MVEREEGISLKSWVRHRSITGSVNNPASAAAVAFAVCQLRAEATQLIQVATSRPVEIRPL